MHQKLEKQTDKRTQVKNCDKPLKKFLGCTETNPADIEVDRAYGQLINQGFANDAEAALEYLKYLPNEEKVDVATLTQFIAGHATPEPDTYADGSVVIPKDRRWAS